MLMVEIAEKQFIKILASQRHHSPKGRTALYSCVCVLLKAFRLGDKKKTNHRLLAAFERPCYNPFLPRNSVKVGEVCEVPA